MTWTDWQPLEQPAAYDGPATYQLRIIDGSQPIAVPRFLGFDHDGLLLVGETRNMDIRRAQFLCGMEKCYGHSAGNLLYYLRLHSPLLSVYADHRLQYRFRKESEKDAARLSEAKLLKTYVRRFGEVPPLNTSLPSRYCGWDDHGN